MFSIRYAIKCCIFHFQVEIIDDQCCSKGPNILASGDFFGDECLVFNLPRKRTARAVTHVDMFCLQNVDLQEAFLSYPEEAERVKGNANMKNTNLQPDVE